ncbi:MAG TPA: LysR family transcriptional regulator, partial [Rhizobium sp.]|nr:LysR family transcriptional regulator [Rhizobium sp.]
PLSLPADPVTMLYRRVDQADGRARWFRRLFLDVAGEALVASGCRVSISRAAA